MNEQNVDKDEAATAERLDELIEEATVDCYDVEEQASGFFNMIDEYLALPFTTRIFGIEVSVAEVELGLSLIHI